jgi:multidrug resistance protein
MLITVPLAGAGVDMFLPSLPAMTKAMDTTSFAVQGTVLIYMGAYGIAQIIFGPLVDRWGRRVPSAIGAAVMAVASVVIANADSIELVLVMRTIQGIGGAVTVVSARSIVADCYDGDARARAANWMTIAWACGPVLSPAIGGYLQEWFGWHATFWVLGGWAALSTVTPLVLLPETRRTKPSGQLRQVFAPYRHIAVDRIYVSAALAMGCLISITYTFEVLAPFYVQIDLKHSPVYYGHLQLIMGALWLAGLLTNRMLTHMSNDFIRTLIAGLAAACISGAMIGVDSASHFSVMWLAVPAGAAYFLGATYWPILYAVCLGRFPYAGGASNALVSGLFSLISGGFALMGTFLHSSTAWPMWSIFLLTLSLSMLIVIIFLRPVLTKGAARLEGIDLRQSASVSNQG